MTVFEIPNVTVEVFANMYRLTANDGYVIHLPQHEEFVYKKVVILQHTFDFNTVQIVAESDLPEGAEILADNKEPEGGVI